jgi:hypothetical protein
MKTTLSVHIVTAEFNLNILPDNAVHLPDFYGEDGRIVELSAVSLADTLFNYA